MESTVSIRDIKSNPFQLRIVEDDKAVQALADEMKQVGFWKHPFRARRTPEGYELVFGHRRLEALKRLGYKRVDVELVDLTDEQMISEMLIENLQRRDLSDPQKAEGVARLVSILTPNGANQNDRSVATKKVADLLGFSQNSINELLAQAKKPKEIKEKMASASTSRRTVAAANALGGDDQKLADDVLEILIDKKVPLHTATDIQQAASGARSAVKAKVLETLVQEIKSGKLDDKKLGERGKNLPGIVKKRINRATPKAKATGTRRKKAPPDLHDILFDWTRFIKNWRQELRAVKPYREYIDEAPEVAEAFRREVQGLIDDLKLLL